ncbi:MAG TPA: LLM class flavin-dependent oxidoreductase [Candidatus Limnocylindrales bacterium]|nr:LLM class flavin-dependent oxidoreductase [Candidatus Limnocylindrales bacterium]
MSTARGVRQRMRVGVSLTTIDVPAGWWLTGARLVEEAGYDALWCWDHFLSRGRRDDPVLECWTTLAAAAARTTRVRVGSLVSNVNNRHPAVLARMVATLADLSGGRVQVGLGIGGYGAEDEAYGIDFPPPPVRVERLEESVAVLRALWTGGPVSFEGRHFRLEGARAFPVPVPPPRIVVGGETPAGARLAARVGDAWATTPEGITRDIAAFREALEEAGRGDAGVEVLLTVDLDRKRPAQEQPIVADLPGELGRWREAGADEVVIGYVRPESLVHVLAAGERASVQATT